MGKVDQLFYFQNGLFIFNCLLFGGDYGNYFLKFEVDCIFGFFIVGMCIQIKFVLFIIGFINVYGNYYFYFNVNF